MQNNKNTVQSLVSANTLGHASYALHFAIGVAGIVPGLGVGVSLVLVTLLLDLLVRNPADGVFEAHRKFRFWSNFWALCWFAATSPLFLLLYVPGAIAWFCIGAWYTVRMARGWRRYACQEMPIAKLERARVEEKQLQQKFAA